MDLNKKLEELKPYQLNCNVFDVYSYNGLSMQDLLCQFFTKINECITVSNETIDLAKWLVNEGLEIEVVKKLMIWLEDGTLENIINVNLFNTLNEKINGLSSQLEQIVVFNSNDLQNDIQTYNKEGKLHIKEGLYRIDNKLTLVSNSVISGKFKKSILKISENASPRESLMYGEDLENVVIENLVFDGFGCNRDSDLYYHGVVEGSNTDMKIVDVEFKNCKNLTIRNCVFKESIYGSIRLTNCENVNFENNLILSSYGHGLIVDKSYNCFIENNRIFNCGKGSRYPYGLNGCGICFIDQTNLNETSHTNIVTNNIIGNCREAGISYEGHRRIISNNIIFNSGLEKSAIKSMSHTIGENNKHNSFRRKQHLIHGNMIIGSLNSTSRTNIAIHCVGSDIEVQGNFIFNRSNEDYEIGKKNGIKDVSGIYIQSLHDGGEEYNGDTRNVFVTNNFIKNVLGRGIYVSGGNVYANNIELKNNKIINTLNSGIVTDKTDGINIEGNLLQNCCCGTPSNIDRPIFINTEINRLILNNNKIIFDDTELDFENKINSEVDGNIELLSCTPNVCQINSNIITGNYSNAIRLKSSNFKDMQINNNMIKPHNSKTAPNSTSGIIFTSSTCDRLNLCNNNIINCNNRAIYLDTIYSGVISNNITDNSSAIVYMKSNVSNCLITGNVGGTIGMAGSSNNINNLIMGNIVSSFAFIDTSNNKVLNNNIDYI